MKKRIKKQFWLTEKENELLKNFSNKTCLAEAEYIRMLLQNRLPKEKPDAEFYETMNQMSQFSEKLQTFAMQLRESQTCNMEILQEEIHRWHQFQLAIEERFLAPEKVSWL